MIKVYKRPDEPSTLATRGYKDDEVKMAILEDQHDKCYLCERKMSTDYQVEHVVSQSGDEKKINEWGNLFMSCNYCNDRKKHLFDDIPLPNSLCFEELIDQQYDAVKAKVNFVTASKDASLLNLIKLLDRLYNGKEPKLGRNLMEKRFWTEFVSSYVGFMRRVTEYVSNPSEENRQKVIDDLKIESTILGFKYSYIKSDPDLREEFKEQLKWN